LEILSILGICAGQRVGTPAEEFQAALGNERSSEQKPKTHVILSERSESKDPLFGITDSSTSPLCCFAQNDMRFRFLFR
jgi:hypothetical protein